jgi:TatD DNase family protein
MSALRSETDEEIEAQIRDGAYKSKQASLFQQQLDLAVELGLNVVIHQRDAWEDTLEVLRPYTGKVQRSFFIASAARSIRRTKFSISTTSFRLRELSLSKTA